MRLLYAQSPVELQLAMAELARDPDFISPKKRKHSDVASSSKRFLRMSEKELVNISKPFVPGNTKKNTDWALTVFREWQSASNATVSEGERQCHSDILEKAYVEELNYWLSLFVGEIREWQAVFAKIHPPNSLWSTALHVLPPQNS